MTRLTHAERLAAALYLHETSREIRRIIAVAASPGSMTEGAEWRVRDAYFRLRDRIRSVKTRLYVEQAMTAPRNGKPAKEERP